MVVVSDTGHVCDAKVIRGFDSVTDKKVAEKAVRDWHFQPAQKNGHAVPVVVRLEVHYARENGDLQLPSAPPPN